MASDSEEKVRKQRLGQSNIVKCIIGLIGLVVCVVFLYIHETYVPNREDITSVVILKLPRSGSSWLAELLNRIPDVYIAKEIIQREDQHLSARDMEAHLKKAISRPVDKIAYRSSWIPSGRFLEDYLFHRTLKPFRHLEAIGLSVNPDYLKNVFWEKFAKKHNVRVIQYQRSNVIKQVVSSVLGDNIKHHCGTNLVRSTTACQDLTGTNSSIAIPPDVFLDRLGRFLLKNKALEQYIQHEFLPSLISETSSVGSFAKPVGQVSTMTVLYENLQLDTVGEVSRILNFIIPDHYYDYETITKWINTKSLFYSSAKKRTPEDLSQALKNYAQINKMFSSQPSCAILSKMLRAKKPQVFDLSPHFSDVETCMNRLGALVHGGRPMENNMEPDLDFVPDV